MVPSADGGRSMQLLDKQLKSLVIINTENKKKSAKDECK